MILLQELLFRDFIKDSFVVNDGICSNGNNVDCDHTIGIVAGVEKV